MQNTTKQLLEHLRDGLSREEMSAASYELARRGNESVQPLLSVLSDAGQANGFRGRAAEALAEIGTPACVKGLMSAAEDESVFVRWTAITALGKNNCTDSVPLLKQHLNDPGRLRLSNGTSLSVKHAARRALSQIEGDTAEAPHDYASNTQAYLEDLETVSVVTPDEAVSLASHRIPPDGRTAAVIEANRKLNSTPFYLTKGKSYRFSAKGDWGNMLLMASAVGCSSTLLKLLERPRRVPHANWFALIGQIENEKPFQINLGRILEIGTVFTAPADGPLNCFANDLWFKWLEAGGSIQLRVRELDLPDKKAIARLYGLDLD